MIPDHESPIAGATRRTATRLLSTLGVVLMLGVAPVMAADTEEETTKLAAAVTPASPAAYAEKGAETCVKCHDKAPATHILRTPHGMGADPRTPFADKACETCHGASPEHLVKPAEGEPRAPVAISFEPNGRTPVELQNKVCFDCHQGSERINWKGSQHQFADVACVSCHDLHTPNDPAQDKKLQAEVCFDCHAEQRAESHRPSRHPIKEGLVACSDCHSAHGSPTPKMLAGVTVNDTCYECHAEKRGPFLWEHAPAREDCSICHSPHGSTQPRLLKARAPFLCQECHMEPFHPSTLYDGTRLATPAAQQQLLGRACLNCHTQVHGSNHPSGVRAMR